MDRLDAMRTFVRVAQAGSLAAVAAELNVARSVVTRQVAALESRLGTKLLARSTRRVALTSAGAVYLEKCQAILDQVAEAEAEAADDRAQPRGHIRLTMPLSLGVRHLMPIVEDFVARHPQVTVDIDFNDRRVDIVEAGLDLSIRIANDLDPSSVARKISVCRSVVAAAPDYLARHGEPSEPGDLIEHDCLTFVPNFRAAWPFIVDDEVRWFPVRSRLRANNGDALLEAAVRGHGVTYLPTFIANREIAAGRLRVLLRDHLPLWHDIHVILAGGRYVPHRVRALVDYLAERTGPSPFWDAVSPLADSAPRSAAVDSRVVAV